MRPGADRRCVPPPDPASLRARPGPVGIAHGRGRILHGMSPAPHSRSGPQAAAPRPGGSTCAGFGGPGGQTPVPRRARTVIVPTYNERDTLEDTVSRVLTVSGEHDLGLSVLVVDDASPDGTGTLADRLAAADGRIAVLHRAAKEGLGPAYVAGFRRALADGAELVFEMDADLSHEPAYLPGMVALIDRGADVVLGSRYVRGGGVTGWGAGRRLVSRGGCLYAQTVLGLPYRDLTGGFKCLRRRVLEALDLDEIAASGYGFQIEVTWRAHRLGFRIAEMPFIFVDRRVGASKMTTDIALEAAALVWRLRFDRRPPVPDPGSAGSTAP